MASELIAGTSQLIFLPLAPALAAAAHRHRWRVAPGHDAGRGALVICYISDRQPRGNHAKPWIEGSKLAQ